MLKSQGLMPFVVAVLIACYVIKKLGFGGFSMIELFGNMVTRAVAGFIFADLGMHPYKNTCLTKDPHGFPESDGPSQYWKDRPKSWKVEYSSERIDCNMDRVRPSVPEAEKAYRPTRTRTIDPEYYENPVEYCKQHPDKYPCPNYWKEDNGANVHSYRTDPVGNVDELRAQS